MPGSSYCTSPFTDSPCAAAAAATRPTSTSSIADADDAQLVLVFDPGENLVDLVDFVDIIVSGDAGAYMHSSSSSSRM